jgi:hypothetical protein
MVEREARELAVFVPSTNPSVVYPVPPDASFAPRSLRVACVAWFGVYATT